MMSSRFATANVADLPPLRVLMGAALGIAFSGAQQAAAQQAPQPAQPQPATGATPVELSPIAIEGAGTQSGYKATLPSLSKLSQPLIDTPQSVNVIPRQLMDDQAITATRDALRTVPGVSLAAGEAGAQGDNLTLRGFTARNDFFLDGMRDFGSYYRDPFNLERIEVLKGPSSVLFGRGSTGGVVHQVSKQPQLAPITAGSLLFGTDGTQRFTVDMNRAVEGLAGTAVRLNVMGDLNGVAGRDIGEYRRFGIAPSVAFGLGTATRLTLNYLHQQEFNTPDYGLPWLYAHPAPVAQQNFYGFANKDYIRTNVDIGTAKLEHDFNDAISLHSQFRVGIYGRDVRITEPQVIYTGVTPTTPLANIRVNRQMIAVKSEETFIQNQTDVTWRVSTGPIEHTIVSGIEIGRETSAPKRYLYSGVPNASLLFPFADTPFLSSALLSTSTKITSNTLGAYLLDTIKFGQYWELTAGVRWDRFETTSAQSVAPATRFSHTDSLPSYRAALNFKPVSNGSIYFAYGTSFNPSAESLSLAASTADLAPEKNETFELGTKWDVLNEKLSLIASVFELEKVNARVPDPNNSLFNVLGGDQRVRGFELGANGYITDQWQVSAGYAYLDTKVVKSSVAASLGLPLANTPRNSFSLWTTYQLPWFGIQIGGGLQYVDSRIASTTPNTTTKLIESVAGYTTVQAMVKMPLRPGVDLQVNGYNLTNERFYDLLHPSHVVPGAGRSVLFSANFKL